MDEERKSGAEKGAGLPPEGGAEPGDGDYQVHPTLSPAPPPYESAGGKKRRAFPKLPGWARRPAFIITVLAVLAAALAAALLAASFRVELKAVGGGFSVSVTRRSASGGAEPGGAESEGGGASGEQASRGPEQGGGSGAHPGHTWDGATLNLAGPDESGQRMTLREIYRKCSASWPKSRPTEPPAAGAEMRAQPPRA
jgi:hypothetical protein